MDTRPDLFPSAQRLTGLLDGVTDDHLARPTPCEGRTVSQLLAHIDGLTAAFRAAADKDFGPLTDTNPDAGGWPEAPSGWREQIPARADALAQAWVAPDAWDGMTRAGGVELPAEVMGLVALGEVTLHGWDLAKATGQSFDIDDATLAVLSGYVQGFDTGGTPGIFGPAVEVPDDASEFDRVLARAGRDPRWQA